MAKSLILLSAKDFVFPSSNFPLLDVVQNRHFLGFDDTTDETCYSPNLVMPQIYNGGALSLLLYYIMASATSGDVYFQAAIEAITDADAVDLDAGSSFDTANSGNATVPGTAGYLDVITITMTNADSIAAGDLFRISINRDADNGSDDAAGDARLLAAELRE